LLSSVSVNGLPRLLTLKPALSSKTPFQLALEHLLKTAMQYEKTNGNQRKDQRHPEPYPPGGGDRPPFFHHIPEGEEKKDGGNCDEYYADNENDLHAHRFRPV
jgi:hypothetical protein